MRSQGAQQSFKSTASSFQNQSKPVPICLHIAVQCGKGNRHLKAHFADEEKKLIKVKSFAQIPQVAQNPGFLTLPRPFSSAPHYFLRSLCLSGDQKTWSSTILGPQQNRVKNHNIFNPKVEKQNLWQGKTDTKISFFRTVKKDHPKGFSCSLEHYQEKKGICRNYGDPLTETQVCGDSIPPKEVSLSIINRLLTLYRHFNL